MKPTRPSLLTNLLGNLAVAVLVVAGGSAATLSAEITFVFGFSAGVAVIAWHDYRTRRPFRRAAPFAVDTTRRSRTATLAAA